MQKECECKSVFNRLSQADRLKIRGIATTRAITSFMRDDTEANPWRYPLYAAVIVTFTTPLPFFGAGTIVMGAMIAWARMERGESAKMLSGRLKEAFNSESIGCNYTTAIAQDENEPESYRVKNLRLLWEGTKHTWADTRDATRIACKALKNMVLRP